MPATSAAPFYRRLALALAALLTTSAACFGAPVPKPMAGQQVRFPQGTWSAVPQLGPDGKVRQCVLVALRQRSGKDGPVDTRLSLNISRGSGLVLALHDDGLATEQVLDDQAESLIGERNFAAVGFPMAGTAFKSPVSDNFEFPVQPSVIPWLRACARRNGIAMEPAQ